MWADLQEYVDSGLLEQIVDGGAELNRSADVAPPVIAPPEAIGGGPRLRSEGTVARIGLCASFGAKEPRSHPLPCCEGIIERQRTIESAGMKQSLLKRG
jgi:hypothetical protein